MALEAGTRVGDYEILALLGAGGMGQVYSARNIISGRTEAMKVLLPDFAAEQDLAARFTAEIRTLASLDHPNIAQLRTAFQFENRLVMIMEYVEGVTLDKRGSEAPIPIDEVIGYSMQVLSALSYAHSKGVTHRDIKPANIMITSHAVVKLMDFGIAKSTNDLQLTRPGTTMGSVYYMSPEQVRGGTVVARSDIYSFGVTLYEMLTGRRPFQADTAYSVLNAQLTEAPAPPMQINPALSTELNNIVLRAMVKSPDGRFQTAEEFRTALRNVQKPQAQPTSSQAFVPGATVLESNPTPMRPVVVPAANPPSITPAASKGHRSLWIGLGAVTAIIAMIAAATVLPRMLATHADQKNTPAVTTTSPPPPSSGDANSGAANPPPATPNPLSSATPAATTSDVNQPGAPATPVHHTQPSTNAPVMKPAVPTESNPPGPTKQEISQARERMIQLDADAESVRAGIQQIRGQQQAQGLDIRGDVLASLNRMNSYLNEANGALNQNDVQAAQDEMDRAEKEISNLKTFLGR
jgi:serine/threonine protein kinase